MKDQQDNRTTPDPQAEKENEAACRDLLGGALAQMDAAFEPEVPQPAWFAGLVERQRKELRRRLLRDLALLWIVGCALLGGMALLMVESTPGFLILQGLATVGGIVLLAGGKAARRVMQSWRS